MKKHHAYTMNPHHQTFVNEMILHNDAVRAYKAAYPNAHGEAARTAAHRLMKKEEIRQPIADAYKQLRLGIREDKAAFLHNELKIIDRKRKMLLELMFGTEDITPRQRMMAMRLDNELAAEQAHLLGYGSLKPNKNHLCEQPHQGRHLEHSERSPEHIEEAKTTKPVTRPEVGQANRNNKKAPLPSLRGSICEGKYVRSNLAVTHTNAALSRDCFVPRNDKEENTEPVTNSNNTSPLERQGEVTFPILPMAYASPAENKTVLLV